MKAADFLGYLLRGKQVVNVSPHYYYSLLCADHEIKRWFSYAFLKSLGWQCKMHQRSVYYDGHERADVVAWRVKFLREMAEFEQLMAKYEGSAADPTTRTKGACPRRP